MGARSGVPIELNYEGDSDEDQWVVYGHEEGDEAIAWAVQRYHDLDKQLPDLGFVVRDQWAQWQIHQGEDGPQQQFFTFWQSGPGRFPVTIAYDGDDWACDERRKVEEAQVKERLKAWVLFKFPEAYGFTFARRYLPGSEDQEPRRSADFKLPGLKWWVTYYDGDSTVWVSTGDLDAYSLYLHDLVSELTGG